MKKLSVSNVLLGCLLHVLVAMVTGEICTSDVCEYEFDVSWARTMTYYKDGDGYRTSLNGSSLSVSTSMYRSNDNAGDVIGINVSPDDVIVADGVERDIIVINGQFPGPTIEVMEGAEVVVKVKNNLMIHGTTIHWHGLFQKGTQFMDGTSGISQCPIHPGQSFTYRFKADPVGTHWYHSHILNQKSDGLFGLFIIHQTLPQIPQVLMSITDWFHVPSSSLAVSNPVGLPGHPRTGAGDMFMINPSDNHVDGQHVEIATLKMQSSLINGRGRFGSDSQAPLTVFEVEGGERYRFRVVCAAQEVGFTVSIDGHQLNIVALDGHEIMTIRADAFSISPGESVDFVVEAEQSPGQYWVRSEAMQHGSEGMDHSNMDHGDMDHSKMDHGDMDHGDMDHSKMDHGDMDHGDMDHGDMDHGDMDHGDMDHGDMDHGDMDHGGMDHSKMNHSSIAHGNMDPDNMDHSNMDHDNMDHGDMNHDEIDHAAMGHKRRRRHGDEIHENHDEPMTSASPVDMDQAHHSQGHAHHHMMVDAVRAIFSYKGNHHQGHDPSSEPRTCTKERPCVTFGCSYQEVTETTRCIGIEEARTISPVVEEYGLDTSDDDVIETFVNVGFAYRSSVNARRFIHPSSPPYGHLDNLDAVMDVCDDKECENGCQCTNILDLPLNKTIQMVISNVRPCAESVVHHAIHLHGHNFAVLAIGYESSGGGMPGHHSPGDQDGHTTSSPMDEHAHHHRKRSAEADDGECDTGNDDIACDSPLCAHASWKGHRPKLNLKNPPVRDTISVPAKGYAVIRFKTENPGFWILHCHNSMHFMEGMAILMQEGKADDMPRFPENFPKCDDFEFTAEDFADYKQNKSTRSACLDPAPSYLNLDFLKGEDTTKLVMPVGTVIICSIALFIVGVITATIPTMCIAAIRNRKNNERGGIFSQNRRGTAL